VNIEVYRCGCCAQVSLRVDGRVFGPEHSTTTCARYAVRTLSRVAGLDLGLLDCLPYCRRDGHDWTQDPLACARCGDPR
jgi:hypothetical protein